MKALKGFIVFILIAIIVGGLGYIGYSFFYMDHSSMSGMSGSQTASTDQSTAKSNTASDSNQSMQGMKGMESMPGMQQDSSSQSQSNSDNQQATNNQVGLNQANVILQNKEQLNKSTAAFKAALELLTVDPYAPSSSSTDNMSNMQMGDSNTASTPEQSNSGNSTINIYPQNNNTVNVVPPSNGNAANTQSGSMIQGSTMQNMGTTYDATKMEKLHTGLYKISVGMALLDQLNNELIYQAENASANTQNLIQYYTNQYSLTVQNKSKLNQALNYINEAATLVNINPYVSSNGLVYDKERMNQIHQSVFKLAEGVAQMNLLNDNLIRQTILLSNTVQQYIDKANADNSSMSSMNMNMSNGGIFSNISLNSVVNIVLILFVIGLIFGIFGFVFSLLKTPAQKIVKKEDAA